MNKKKTNVVLMGNGSPDNGGCEAITKGTVEILKATFPNVEVTDCYFDYTGHYSADTQNGVHPIAYPARWTPKWWFLQPALQCSLMLTSQILFASHKHFIRQADVVLSLGGDNYSLDYGVPRRFIAMGQYVKRLGTPFVIWGASVGPFADRSAFERRMAAHLRSDVDLILLREEASRAYLQQVGVTQNVRMVADPAFMMQPEESAWRLHESPSRYVCINFSSLMAKYVTGGQMEPWVKMCAETIDTLAKRCDGIPLVFIPHVKADYDFMQAVMPHLQDKGCVIMADKRLNAAQMKGVIAHAMVNVACRTHSTIASFSTAVPTISLGYSIKSKGLNLQMYGHEDYLVYTKAITPSRVADVFSRVWQQRDTIRHGLEAKNAEIKRQALMAGTYVKQLIESRQS